MNSTAVLSQIGLEQKSDGQWVSPFYLGSGAAVRVVSPIDEGALGTVGTTSQKEYDVAVEKARGAFQGWRMVPAPKRGEIVRQMAEAIREHQKSLGTIVTLETGKILPEGLGEVQEAIDVADFAVGLSRQLYGKTMHSERPAHRMYEQWHPLGAIGVITAFNFPAAVWAWNAMIAGVCGDTVVWKPSELAPLTALAMHHVCAGVLARHGFTDVFQLVIGEGPSLGQSMAGDARLPLISATGSCRMGRSVAETVAKRLGRCLLELGGNNAVTVLADADLNLVVRSTVFGAVGTAGQRCTTTRRLFVEKPIVDEVVQRLIGAYRQVKIGNPLDEGTLLGPLIHERARADYQAAIETAREQGGEVVYGGKVLSGMPSSLYVEPTIIRAARPIPLMQEETFAPILYVVPVSSVEEAIEFNNGVRQGLSSAIFTSSVQSAEKFLSHAGSDCGIANVNLGTSGAEIGGAFGGEKETGGGRESGSDSWKQYMRRQTSTINWGTDLPLAQGIKFDIS